MACWQLPDLQIDKKSVLLVLSTAVSPTQQVEENCGILVIKVDRPEGNRRDARSDEIRSNSEIRLG